MALFNRLMLNKFSIGFIRYAFSGLSRRFSQKKSCPDCGCAQSLWLDRKGFHGLYECVECGVCFRYPYETDEEMAAFYQHDYESASIATDIPKNLELEHLLKDGVAGTQFDRAWHLRVFRQLGLHSGAKVLDFGTSWGYFTLQLKQAGFAASGFEISKSRAAIGAQLGVNIYSDEGEIPTDLDVVCSTHVIEHVPRPLEKLRQMLSWVKPGGMVIAYTPNASKAVRQRAPTEFHQAWGRVHPRLLSAECVSKEFPDHTLFLTSDDSAEKLAKWDHCSRIIDICDGAGLLIAIRRAS